ncbi:MAG TPA: S8 family serine peptidase [Candidatus Bathyarchaeia archaeon]|nr:S8 family serine peptidase [Candidatus Bathyarchaeia archaeon]
MKFLAVAFAVILVIGVLFGTGLIQQFLFKPSGYNVDSSVKPFQDVIPDMGRGPRPLAAFQDSKGHITTFVANEVIYTPSSPSDLSAFLTRYNGKVIGNSSIPPPPPGVKAVTGVGLRPISYTIRLDPSTFNLQNFASDAKSQGFNETVKFSSDNAAKLLALVLHEQANGAKISLNLVTQPQDYIYGVNKYSWTGKLSRGLPNPQTGDPNAMRWLVFNDTADQYDALVLGVGHSQCTDNKFIWTCPPRGSTYPGSESNIFKAWQFVAAHCAGHCSYRPKIAIIDGGFWLDSQGNAQQIPGWGSGLPSHPLQYNFLADNYIAYGISPQTCSQNSPCPFHGYEAALTAVGALISGPTAGTGGQVADPILFLADGTDDTGARALETAIAWGADIVSMSFGGTCSTSSWMCRSSLGGAWHDFASAIDDANNHGVLLVAAAGNNGVDASDTFPCNYGTLCVGALADGEAIPASYSNYGTSVNIWAPSGIPQPSIQCSDKSTGTPGDANCAPGTYTGVGPYYGTSASTPFVAGVAAMVKAMNPSLSGSQLANALLTYGHGGPASMGGDEVNDQRRLENGDLGGWIYRLNAYASVVAAAGGYNLAPDVHIVNPKNNPDYVTNQGSGFVSETVQAWAYDIDDSGPLGNWPLSADKFQFSGPGSPTQPSCVYTSPGNPSLPETAKGTVTYHPSPVEAFAFMTPPGGCLSPYNTPLYNYGVVSGSYSFTNAQPGKYTMTVTATNSYKISAKASAVVIVSFSNAPPQPIITLPSQGDSYQVGIPVQLHGYARSTDPGNLIGWTPCNQMTFSGKGANTFQIQTLDTSIGYQQDGICLAQETFTSPGLQTIVLDAWNRLNQHGQAEVTINIVQAPPPGQPSEFDFSLSLTPTATRLVPGGSATFTITVSQMVGSKQTVTLGIIPSGVPQGATYNFNPTSGDPSYVTTLTIKTTFQTPPKTYLMTIIGTGGGKTHELSITLYVEQAAQ